MKAQIVSFHCVLKNQLGRILSSTFNKEVITHIGGVGMLTALAEGMQNMQSGEKRRISLRAEQAYGFYDPEQVIVRERDDLPADIFLKVGDEVPLRAKAGELKPFRVTQITGEMVVLDGNHPLAGQDLIFEIDAVSARDATVEEIAESSEAPSEPLLH
jgi:FKBP-type peptidyl-prolyl cis-trans isomerase SlyD